MSTEVKNWTSNQLAFIAWLATPTAAREPGTQAEFASKLGVRPETLSRWKADPELTREVGNTARELLHGDLPDIYQALRRHAKRGSFQHIKLALELADHYTERSETTVKNSGQVEIVIGRSEEAGGAPDDAGADPA